MLMHPAERYNKIRRIIFSTANDPQKGFDTAWNWLSNYQKNLDRPSYTGLCAELAFYQHHSHDFSLTVAGDMGEHADFAGIFEGRATRFDVTTNLSYKNFETYQPYMGRGPRYKVVVVKNTDFEVIDVLDLAFPRCHECDGYLFPAVVMCRENHNRHGDPMMTYDQVLMDICSGCDLLREKSRTSHYDMPTAQEYLDEAWTNDADSASASTEQHLLKVYKHFQKDYDQRLMILGSHQYVITDQDGGGYWGINFDFVNKAVEEDVPREPIECGPDF
jgi:hypothetical protein